MKGLEHQKKGIPLTILSKVEGTDLDQKMVKVISVDNVDKINVRKEIANFSLGPKLLNFLFYEPFIKGVLEQFIFT